MSRTVILEAVNLTIISGSVERDRQESPWVAENANTGPDLAWLGGSSCQAEHKGTSSRRSKNRAGGSLPPTLTRTPVDGPSMGPRAPCRKRLAVSDRQKRLLGNLNKRSMKRLLVICRSSWCSTSLNFSIDEAACVSHGRVHPSTVHAMTRSENLPLPDGPRWSSFFTSVDRFRRLLENTNSVVMGEFAAGVVTNGGVDPNWIDLAILPAAIADIVAYLEGREGYMPADERYQLDGMELRSHFWMRLCDGRRVFLHHCRATPFETFGFSVDYSLEMCLMTSEKGYCLCPFDILENEIVRPLQKWRTYGMIAKFHRLSGLAFQHVKYGDPGPDFSRKRMVGDGLTATWKMPRIEGSASGGSIFDGSIRWRVWSSGSTNTTSVGSGTWKSLADRSLSVEPAVALQTYQEIHGMKELSHMEAHSISTVVFEIVHILNRQYKRLMIDRNGESEDITE
ncbi:hypothetical protein PISL3812_10048 [Talaromyces islandicus]|uniref:Uncharacterized protein n=1 Tax=Talaromyces islandicus TaxID=28573 RepID=A0A0U1MCV7_TALIS|nr:hypothetical protein PISL3812_10048 [Talaromyces islandicus]